jgi:hypothetical protein
VPGTPGIAIIAALIVAAVVGLGIALWKTRAFERFGGRLAGDHRRAAAAAARATSPVMVAPIAQLVAVLAPKEERRVIRWTPARSATGARLALGASPAAWYLWLPDPEVLVRVPDALIASAVHEPEREGVIRLHCTTRACDVAVTATDGTVLEEAEHSEALAAALLDGLLVADPQARPSAGVLDDRPATDGRLALTLAS